MSETDDTADDTNRKYSDAAEILDAATTFEERTVQSQGKIDLNPQVIDHLGIGDRVLDLRIHAAAETFPVGDVILHGDGRYRFTIPHRKRELYSVEPGDAVDVEIVNVHLEGNDA
jgi:hypothetical protein